MSRTAKNPRPPSGTFPERLRLLGERLVFSSAFYRASLMGPVPDHFAMIPAPLGGDEKRGADIMAGEWTLAGERLAAENPFAAELSAAAAAELHGFGWLADLRAEGSDRARAYARALIAAWIERHGEWAALPWRADVLGRRLYHWLAESNFFHAGSDPAFRKQYLRAVARQVRHLDRVARRGGPSLGPAGHGRIEALVAFVHASACLPAGAARLPKALVLLLRETGRQVLPDGGHYQRSPALQRDILRALVGVRATLTTRKYPVPSAIQTTIDRMAPMLSFYRHGDGRLALFNHSAEDDEAEIERVLASTNASPKPPAGAPHTGFQRLNAGHALVIMDTGAPPPPGSDDRAHAGTLSFEMSYGAERMIVNCGARLHAQGDWLAAQRATAAHSTLVLANANSSDVLPDGGLGRRPRHVLCRREEADGATLIDASHDGYAPNFGALHRRRLYLAPEGGDLRGEDRLSRVRPGPVVPFAIRFHLHPDIQVSLLHDGAAALLRLGRGVGFRLDASGGQLALEESIYLGGTTPRRCEQIVIESKLVGEEAMVKWSLKRVSGG